MDTERATYCHRTHLGLEEEGTSLSAFDAPVAVKIALHYFVVEIGGLRKARRADSLLPMCLLLLVYFDALTEGGCFDGRKDVIDDQGSLTFLRYLDLVFGMPGGSLGGLRT